MSATWRWIKANADDLFVMIVSGVAIYYAWRFR